jgi:hypothetical protein
VEPSLVGLEPPLLPSIRPPEAGHAVSPRTERRLLRLERSRERCAQPRQVCDHNGVAGPRHSCRGAERPGGSEPTPCRGQKLRNRVPSVAARARAFGAFWRVVSAPGGLRGGVRSPRGFIGAANDDRGARAQRTALFACAATLGTPNTRALDAQRGVRRKFRHFFVLSVFEGNKKSLRAVAGEVRRSGRTINKQSGPDMTFGQPIKDWVVRI